MNKQSWKRLKRGKHEKWSSRGPFDLSPSWRSVLLTVHSSWTSVFSLFFSIYHIIFLSFSVFPQWPGGQISCLVTNSSIQFTSVLFCVIGPWLPWRRHWLWVLEVGHHNCWDGQPADRTEREKTSCKECDFSFKVTLKHYFLNSLLPKVNEFLLRKNIGVWHTPLNP